MITVDKFLEAPTTQILFITEMSGPITHPTSRPGIIVLVNLGKILFASIEDQLDMYPISQRDLTQYRESNEIYTLAQATERSPDIVAQLLERFAHHIKG